MRATSTDTDARLPPRRAANAVGPERARLGEDQVAEHVRRARQRESRVRVEALQASRARRARDAPAELRTETSLLLVRRCEAAREVRILLRVARPPVDPTR